MEKSNCNNNCNNNCNTCYDKTDTLNKCFNCCSYSQCDTCILKWLKIEENTIKYICPQCKYISLYKLNQKFTEWCVKPDVTDKVYSKFLDKLKNKRDIEDNEDQDIIDYIEQEERISDLVNIRNHHVIEIIEDNNEDILEIIRYFMD
jgi:hypothetical protein